MSSRYAKEFHRLKQSLEKKTNGQASIKDWDPENITTFIVEVSPQGGPYKRGKFLFQIIVPDLYPDVHPDVVCLTDIYHPNIDSEITDEHNICLNLFDEWNKSFGLEDCVQGLIFLLYNPNLSDPISSLFDGSEESQESFASKVQASLRGESFDGISFAKNPGYAGQEDNCKEEKTGAMSAEETITNSEADEPTERQNSTDKEESEESEPSNHPPCTNAEPGDVDEVKVEVKELTSPDVNPPSINSVSKLGDHSPEEQVNGDELNGEKSSAAIVIDDGEKTVGEETKDEENGNTDVEVEVEKDGENERTTDVEKEETNFQRTDEEKEEPEDEKKETKDMTTKETKDETNETSPGERKEDISLEKEETKNEEDELEKETTNEKAREDDSDEDYEDVEEIAWNMSKLTTDDEEEKSSVSLDSVSSDDDPHHANFLPYEEPEFSWTEQELNEEQPYMDALGCRFLYPNQSDSSRDLSDYCTSEPDSDLGDAGYIFDYVGDDEEEEDGEGGGEIIEIGSSRIIIRAVRARTGRHRRREILVVEEMESGLRRNIIRALAFLRPFHHLLWPNLVFVEFSVAWLFGLSLFGSERRRITRRVLR